MCGSSKWREGDQVEERKKDVHVVVMVEREKCGLLFLHARLEEKLMSKGCR